MWIQTSMYVWKRNWTLINWFQKSEPSTSSILLEWLPIDVLKYLLLFLGEKDLLQLSMVCKKLNSLINEEGEGLFWKRLVMETWTGQRPLSSATPHVFSRQAINFSKKLQNVVCEHHRTVLCEKYCKLDQLVKEITLLYIPYIQKKASRLQNRIQKKEQVQIFGLFCRLK